MTKKSIDTRYFSERLRSRGVNLAEKKVRLTLFGGSNQEGDLTLPPNCGGVGRIHHFRRHQGDGWPDNPLPTDPAAHMLGLPFKDEIQVQVFQNAVCSWRCWYCFVDFDLLVGSPGKSTLLSAEELLARYMAEEFRVPIIDLSGGQPDLVPEWTLWMLDEIDRQGLSSNLYVWSDDNLSNDYVWQFLSDSEIARLVSYKNYGKVGCFKGFDEESFAFNTRAEPDLFLRQFELMRRLVLAGFDIYGYATFTHCDQRDIAGKMRRFLDMLQERVDPLFPLRMVPLRVREFSPTVSRMGQEERNSLKIQDEAVAVWCEELGKRFSREELARRIFDHELAAG